MLLGSVAGGLVLGAAAGLTPVPAWLLSLAALSLLGGLAFDVATPQLDRIADPSMVVEIGRPWLGIVAVTLSILGGLAFATPAVRRVLRLDQDLEGPDRRTQRLPAALVGMGGSAAMGGLAGVTLSATAGTALASTLDYSIGVLVAAVMLGVVSVFGRRSGIAGAVLAATLYIVGAEWISVATDAGEIAGPTLTRAINRPHAHRWRTSTSCAEIPRRRIAQLSLL